MLVAAWAIGCGRAEVVGGEGARGAVEVAAVAGVEVEAPPELLYVGCEAVRAGPVCMLRPDATLRLWLGVHPETPMRAELDGVAIAVQWVAAEDGLRAVFVPPVASGVLTLRAEDAGWKIELGVVAAEAMPAELVAVQAEIDRGDADAAEKLLAVAMPGLTGVGRAEGLKLRADVAFVRGDLQAALAGYEPAFVAARDAGLLRRASEVALTASYLCTAVLYDLAGARGWLARHAELVPLLPEAKVRHSYYAGLVANFAGDLRNAQNNYEAHASRARALGMDRELSAALSFLAVLRGQVGDVAGAQRNFAELFALGDRISIWTRAMALHNTAWVALEARFRGQDAQDPVPPLMEAIAIFAPGGPVPDPLLEAEARLNLVYALLLRGDANAARALLPEIKVPTRALRRWRDYLVARSRLLGSETSTALANFSAVGQDAADAGDRGLEWSAAIGAGEALEKLGRLEDALERYRHAAAIHSGDLAAVAVDAGRDRFAAERDRGAQRLVMLLLRLGRESEALCVARQARRQGFAGLAVSIRSPAALATYRAARAELDAKIERSWELSRRAGERARVVLRMERRALDSTLDAMYLQTPPVSERVGVEMPSEPGGKYECHGFRWPVGDELMLVYYPVEAGYVAFGVNVSEIIVARIDGKISGDPWARAAVLLGPFAPAIRRARRVDFVTSGSMSEEAFHALPWGQGVLIDSVVIAYALDLPARVRSGTRLRRSVQLAPPSNLVGVVGELEIAASGLRASGVSVERLVGDETDLIDRISGVDLLHYAGHARGGGWGGALDLGGDRALGARDLLTIVAPRVAVLSGCETGLPDPRAHGGGMSLAHALLIAGAEAVLATDAVVDDTVGAAFGSAVVLAIADGREPAEALAEVQRTQRLEGWERFRAFTP